MTPFEEHKALCDAMRIINEARMGVVREFGANSAPWTPLYHAENYLSGAR